MSMFGKYVCLNLINSIVALGFGIPLYYAVGGFDYKGWIIYFIVVSIIPLFTLFFGTWEVIDKIKH